MCRRGTQEGGRLPKIKDVIAKEVLDSNKTPTLEVKVVLDNGISGTAAVPSGASTGAYEALELRDNDPKRYEGKGALKAVDNVNKIIRLKLRGMEVTNQAGLDNLMIKLDGTPNKSRLGANAIVGVSVALARCAANVLNMPLFHYLRKVSGLTASEYAIPVPMMVMIEGGKHGRGNNLSIQEFCVIGEVEDGQKVWDELKKILESQGQETTMGLEGGFAPKISSHEEALDFLVTAISDADLRPGKDIRIGVDVAASYLYKDGTYTLEDQPMNTKELIKHIDDLTDKYPIYSIEDGLAQDDWEGWQMLEKLFGDHRKIIGDDIFVTNTERIKKGIVKKVANAVLIKPNQIGTVTETLEAIKITQGAGWNTIISHRSGETLDTFIADLAVAANSLMLKTGAPTLPERKIKYDRLKEIDSRLSLEMSQ